MFSFQTQFLLTHKIINETMGVTDNHRETLEMNKKRINTNKWE